MPESVPTVASANVSHSRISRAVLVPNLKSIRERALLTQKDLAKRAGVSRATISRGEQGGEVRISNIRKLARALRCQPQDLLGPI